MDCRCSARTASWPSSTPPPTWPTCRSIWTGSKLTVIFPSTKKAAADPYFRQQGTGPEWQARAIAVGELKFGRDLTVVVPNQTELFKIFREAVEGAFFGKMSAKAALDWAVREWNARL